MNPHLISINTAPSSNVCPACGGTKEPEAQFCEVCAEPKLCNTCGRSWPTWFINCNGTCEDCASEARLEYDTPAYREDVEDEYYEL
jgi:hypothetical protein